MPSANRVLVMSNKKIAMYDTVEKVFARAPELLELGLSVPQVTKIFLKLREMGVDVPADVYTIPYAVKMMRQSAAGMPGKPVLPRSAARKGGAADAARYHHRPALPGQQPRAPVRPRLKLVLTIAYIVLLFAASNPLGLTLSILFLGVMYKVAKIPFKMIFKSLKPILPIVLFTAVLNLFFVSGEGDPLVDLGLVFDHLRRGRALRGADGSACHGTDRGHKPADLHHQPHRADRCH